MTRALVLADTHVADGSLRRLPEAVLALAAEADVILHVGDVTGPRLLAELARYAPVHAVLGNNDAALAGRLAEELVVDLDGVAVAMVHDSGPRAARERRLRRRFPAAAVVLFGHSHIPFDGEGVDGQRLFNPGSPTQRRAQPERTVGWLEAVAGTLVDHQLIALGP